MRDRDLLGVPMHLNDAHADTVGEYLTALLTVLWEEGESFDAKRPFGNSDWTEDLYIVMVQSGAAAGTINEDGMVEDPREAHQAVFRAIAALR